MAGRALISKLPSLSLAARSTISSPLRRLRPLLAAASPTSAAGGIPARRRFSAEAAAPDYPGSLLNYPPPEGGAPEKDDPAFDGMDFEHWLVILEDQDPSLSRDQLIDSYVKTFAKITGSEEEAKKKMYSVSTKHYFAFGVLVEEEVSYKIKNLPGVKWVLPDSYINRETKDYGGEPFIQGQALPYDPKYHEEWLHNYHTSKKSTRQPPRNDQPRFFPRGNENMNFQNRDAPPMPNQGSQSPPQQGDSPMNSSSNVQNAPQIPISEFNAVQPNTPARTYPKQTPPPQSNYAPTGPTYQGNGQNYQVVNPGPAHQGNGQGYQGGYQQRDGRIHQQDGFPGHQQQAYQSGPNYPPNRPSYQQGGQGVGGPAYQQGGQGVGGPAYQRGGPGYQGFQSPPQQGDRPPRNSRSNLQNAPQTPNSQFNGVQPNTPARTYPNQTPFPQSNYAPTGPAYQGNGQNYQVVGPGPAHQGNEQGYQDGYQRGDGRNYQQNGFPGHQQQAYQFGPNYPPNRPSYQQGGQGVGGPAYQQGRQGVNGSGYQGFQSPPQQGDRPPMNSSGNVQNAPQMPNSEFNGLQPDTPARSYPNQRTFPQSNYAPTGPAYQGNGQNYQVVIPRPAHQGNGQGGGQGVGGPGYQGFQSSPLQGDRPPMNSSSNVQNAPQMPNSEFNGIQPNTPARTYPNERALPQSNYAPTGPAYQGNGQNYQVVNPHPAHQGNRQGYHGGYQHGDGRYYQQDGFPGHQQQACQSGPNYPPNIPSYQQSGQGVGGPAYQQGGQGVSGPGYQQGARGAGTQNYQSVQGVGRTNVPGRDY